MQRMQTWGHASRTSGVEENECGESGKGAGVVGRTVPYWWKIWLRKVASWKINEEKVSLTTRKQKQRWDVYFLLHKALCEKSVFVLFCFVPLDSLEFLANARHFACTRVGIGCLILPGVSRDNKKKLAALQVSQKELAEREKKKKESYKRLVQWRRSRDWALFGFAAKPHICRPKGYRHFRKDGLAGDTDRYWGKWNVVPSTSPSRNMPPGEKWQWRSFKEDGKPV